MTARADPASSVLDRIRHSLVGLRMPRALEMIDATVRQLERGEVSPLERSRLRRRAYQQANQRHDDAAEPDAPGRPQDARLPVDLP